MQGLLTCSWLHDAEQTAWGARMGGCSTGHVEPKLPDNGMVVRGERRASLVRGLALPERPRRSFAFFLVVRVRAGRTAHRVQNV